MGVTQTSVSEDDFFKENIVNNIAALLGIDKKNIRVMNVVSAGGNRRRRRRSTDLSYIEVHSQHFNPYTEVQTTTVFILV